MMAMASVVEAIGFKMIGHPEVAAFMMIEETTMVEGSMVEEEAAGKYSLNLLIL